VAGKIGEHILFFDNLCIQVPAETDCHYENQGLDHFAAESVGNGEAFAEIHLRRLAGGQNPGCRWLPPELPEFLQHPSDRELALGESKLILQNLVNGAAAYIIFGPPPDLLLVRQALRLMDWITSRHLIHCLCLSLIKDTFSFSLILG
jgi:hypothetical protein